MFVVEVMRTKIGYIPGDFTLLSVSYNQVLKTFNVTNTMETPDSALGSLTHNEVNISLINC